MGGEIIRAGGTGRYLDNAWATEIQASSYPPMDTAYGKIGHPFGQALSVLGPNGTERLRVLPAHGETVLETWPVDMRGW